MKGSIVKRYRFVMVLWAALCPLFCASCWDDFSDALIGTEAPAIPGVAMKDGALTSTSVTLNWTEPDAVTYLGVRVACSGNGSSTELFLAKGTTSYTFSGLSDSAEYTITLQALFGSGDLSGVTAFRVTPTNKTLRFVDTAQELDNARSNPEDYYILTADLDLSGYGGGTGWTPIGPFNGTFDGNGHVVRNLTINNPSAMSQGLFGVTGSGAVVENLGVENVSIAAGQNTGGLAGSNGGTIRNCHAAGVINSGSTSSNYGGLAGSNSGNIQYSYSNVTITTSECGYIGGFVGQTGAGTIEYCYALGDLTCTSGTTVGGFAGAFLGGTIRHCYSSGNVSTSGSINNIGGFAGTSSGTISDCYSSGNVSSSGGSIVGGFAGAINSGTISNCHSSGNTSGSATVGGFAGYIIGTVNNCYSSGSISSVGGSSIGGFSGRINGIVNNCYSTGSVSAGSGSQYIGGFTGRLSGTVSYSYSSGSISASGCTDVGGFAFYYGTPTITSCYFDLSTAGQTDTNATGLTTGQMKDSSNYSGWDFATIWGISLFVNGGYPYLR